MKLPPVLANPPSMAFQPELFLARDYVELGAELATILEILAISYDRYDGSCIGGTNPVQLRKMFGLLITSIQLSSCLLTLCNALLQVADVTEHVTGS